jgi:selenium metabolism protein YedF
METKQFLDNNDVTEMEIVVDGQTAAENVSRFLGSRGFSASKERDENGDNYLLRAARLKEHGEVVEKVEKKALVFINGETLGRGDDGLGRILILSFLHTLKELEVPPWRVIFINGGVKLVAEGSEALTALKEITDLGADILACGTCLDYFHLKDKVKVGRISNMYEIASSFLEATHVIKP